MADGAVLLVGTEPRVIAALARSFHRCGRRVVAALHSSAPAVRSRYVAANVRLPELRVADPALLDALAQTVRTHGCAVLVPCSDSALRMVVAHEAALRALCHVEAPPGDVIDSVLEKDRTLRAAAACGLALPEEYELADRAALHAARARLRFPVIAKPRSKMGAGSERAFKLRYYADFAALDAEFAADARFGPTYLLQEYCPGYGVGVQMLVRDGEPVAVSQHRRLKEHPAAGGVAVVARSEAVDERLAGPALALLRALRWDGIAMVEFRHDPASGRTVLMEVNGRFWGSCPLALMAGVDYPALLCAEWAGRPRGPVVRSRPGVRMLWLTGDLLRVADVARAPSDGLPRPSLAAAVGALVRDLVVPHRHALFRLDDPRPAVEELGRAAKRIVVDEGARLAARLLPGWLKLHLRTYRQLEPSARRVYLRRYWQRRLGRTLPAARATPETRSILFVCHGNIMRSALAEALMRRSLAEAAGDAADGTAHGAPATHGPFVASAGLFARPGREADRRMAAVAPTLGADLSAHRAQPVTDALIAAADLVVVMDFLNESRMLARFPASAPKLARITDFLPEADRTALGGRVAELADPYHGGMAEVDRCARLVREATDALTAAVVGRGRAPAVAAGRPAGGAARVGDGGRRPELAEPRS